MRLAGAVTITIPIIISDTGEGWMDGMKGDVMKYTRSEMRRKMWALRKEREIFVELRPTM